jgi:methylenetetrahydrofolate reductase (NADPH)
VINHPDTLVLMRFKDSPLLTTAKPGSIPSNFFITPAEASVTASTSFDKHKFSTNLPTGSSNQAGNGALNNISTWDEFPNGRFGDAKSPAFGQTDLWDSGLGVSPNDGIKRWGRPKTPSDVTSVFLAHLEGRVQTTPWSDGPLDRESVSILSHLKKLNERGWWTVGSQPAVDATPSSDETYGWGPRGGYVFQKAFVEFFATKEEVQQLREKIEKHGRWQLAYFAANMLVCRPSLAPLG